MEIAMKNCFLLISLISDILDYSQIQKNKLRLNPAPFSLLTVVKDIFDLCSMQASQKGISLVLNNLLEEHDLILFSDSNRIK